MSSDPLTVPFGPVHPGDNPPDSSVFEVPDGRTFVPPDADTLNRVMEALADEQ